MQHYCNPINFTFGVERHLICPVLCLGPYYRITRLQNIQLNKLHRSNVVFWYIAIGTPLTFLLDLPYSCAGPSDGFQYCPELRNETSRQQLKQRRTIKNGQSLRAQFKKIYCVVSRLLPPGSFRTFCIPVVNFYRLKKTVFLSRCSGGVRV